MIIRFTVNNFRSFKNKVTLDFVSNSHIPFDEAHKMKFGRLGVLKNVGIFGANASGKTTIISAIKTMKDFVVSGRISSNLAFKGQENKPTSFNLIFETDNKFFEYSFSVKNNKSIGVPEVLEESLYELHLSGKNDEIYSSKNGLPWNVSSELDTFLRGYKNTIGTLFLKYIVAPERKINGIDKLNIFESVFNFFLMKIFVSVYQRELLFSISKKNVNTIQTKLHEYDTGIESVDFNDISDTDRRDLLNDTFVKNIILRNLLADSKNGPYYFSNNSDIFMFEKRNKEIIIEKLLFKHTNIDEKFSFKDESEGTKIIFCLIVTLLCSNNEDRTVFIDEIERSSHPIVVLRVIEDYQRLNKGSKSQLAFTSHLSSLMDRTLNRDEIYFVEKNDYGVSSIKTLQQFATRNRREKISTKYLEGRYGAVPNVGVNVEVK